jgi:hypothetical protein
VGNSQQSAAYVYSVILAQIFAVVILFPALPPSSSFRLHSLCLLLHGDNHKVHILSTTVYVPSSELGLSHLLSRQRVCPSPRTKKGGGRVRGWGSPNSDDCRKSLTLCLLCGDNHFLLLSVLAPPPANFKIYRILRAVQLVQVLEYAHVNQCVQLPPIG